jgi:tungstate transport system substrate-binding protein
MKKLLVGLVAATFFAGSLLAETLMMATTTSTEDTGLLDALAPKFEKETGITLKWVSTGTGKALKMGENCDVDVLLVHSPSSEKTFIDSGFGVNRQEVMYNDFVIIGPKNDPIKIEGMTTASAFKKIKDEKANFISRGDSSGTHNKEVSVWKNVSDNVPEKENWYIQSGQGMIITINMAAEKNGYTLTDRGTWIKYESQKGDENGMKIVVENDNVLFNQYSVITIDKDRCKSAKSDLATEFTNWMTKDEIQKYIGEFTLLNKPLFIPNAKK